jgi:hypothetical protein
MKIPEDAVIAREKLTEYLLVFQPESDKSQFLAQAGFTLDNPDELEAAIREMIATHEAVMDRQDRFGDFFRVEGTLKGVNERDLLVVTIWIIRTEEDGVYRFVTLKPLRSMTDGT